MDFLKPWIIRPNTRHIRTESYGFLFVAGIAGFKLKMTWVSGRIIPIFYAQPYTGIWQAGYMESDQTGNLAGRISGPTTASVPVSGAFLLLNPAAGTIISR